MSNQQTVPDLFNATRLQWLESARVTARRLLRDKRFITIEDVLSAYPRPKYLRPNVTGSVFKDSMFQHAGYTKSKRLISHARVISIWTISDSYADTLVEIDCEA